MSVIRQCDRCGKTAKDDTAEVQERWVTVRMATLKGSKGVGLGETELCTTCRDQVKQFIQQAEVTR